MALPKFNPHPEFYRARQEGIRDYLRAKQRHASFPVKGSEARINRVNTLVLHLYKYIEKRNKILQLNLITTLPKVEIARSQGVPINMFVLNVGHFEGQYQFRPQQNLIFGSLFTWRDIDPNDWPDLQ